MITPASAIKKTWFFWKNRYYFLKDSNLSEKTNRVSFVHQQGDTEFCRVAEKSNKGRIDDISDKTSGAISNYISAIRSSDKINAQKEIVNGLKAFKKSLKEDPEFEKIADELIWDEVDK